MRIQQSRIYRISKETYISNLKSINFQKVKECIQKGQLSEKEFEELYAHRNTVLIELEKMPVDLCPVARWFYNEIIDKVNTYFARSEDIEETIEYVIDFFEIEFRNKACAK